ncbi:hypothetical protein JAAARDRAFT_221029 [Jaapia argillacea MUCL 33604]|uniref:Uncharacterized protein n=1 Tax=Jaapia argillacea MUCL 33604 TaxID=933084 RepID=A0A067QB28_9AGAM|nr:hypothetical protein JAAARDRAFT_221029 [Jaapia argillacea MUCL 33604]
MKYLSWLARQLGYVQCRSLRVHPLTIDKYNPFQTHQQPLSKHATHQPPPDEPSPSPPSSLRPQETEPYESGTRPST